MTIDVCVVAGVWAEPIILRRKELDTFISGVCWGMQGCWKDLRLHHWW